MQSQAPSGMAKKDGKALRYEPSTKSAIAVNSAYHSGGSGFNLKAWAKYWRPTDSCPRHARGPVPREYTGRPD